MKKIIIAALLALPMAASAQSAFTVDNNGKKYSFPITSTITVTDNKPSNLVEAPAYKTDMKSVHLFGSATGFLFPDMHLVSDYVWAGKLKPTAGKTFKFSVVSKTSGDQYYGPDDNAENFNVPVHGTAIVKSTKFYNFEEGYDDHDSILVTFDERSGDFCIFGLRKLEITDPTTLTTLNFDDDKWTALIDSNEDSGKLLYGESGSGYATDDGVYEWTDDDTQLHSKLNESWGSWAYWNGGVAVSNYHCAIADGSASKQLSIPTDLNAHSGNNFLVAFGYSDDNYDMRPVIDFKDGKARMIKGLWATNTSYFLNSLKNGDGFSSAATADTYVDAVFEGFDSTGKSTGTVKLRIQDGTTSITEWKYVDLSSLGKICTLKITYSGSTDRYNSYGYATPSYIAIDDIEIYK